MTSEATRCGEVCEDGVGGCTGGAVSTHERWTVSCWTSSCGTTSSRLCTAHMWTRLSCPRKKRRCEECEEASSKVKQQLASSEELMRHSPDSRSCCRRRRPGRRAAHLRGPPSLTTRSVHSVVFTLRFQRSRLQQLRRRRQCSRWAAARGDFASSRQFRNPLNGNPFTKVEDCPGVKLKCVRGKCDLPQVIKLNV
ncbi:hypothetical protein PYW08_011476 [Mythimna loreyi]|uniref:Uncharacterized protein n=1 Tax=Mythimna loreyi TaxID=667449 RepID=A0ACC2QNI1_9NEOP|nr:hypothetical protein PYW08_011476 [Mythimna loreyi]